MWDTTWAFYNWSRFLPLIGAKRHQDASSHAINVEIFLLPLMVSNALRTVTLTLPAHHLILHSLLIFLVALVKLVPAILTQSRTSKYAGTSPGSGTLALRSPIMFEYGPGDY